MKKLALAMTACAALALTGCGEDSTPTADESKAPATTAPATLTKAEFQKQADKICADSNAKIEEASAALTESSTEEEVKAFVVDTALPEGEEMVAKIDALVPPAEIAGDVDAMIAEVNAEMAKVEADWTYLLADESFATANKMATDLGLPACGE